MFNNKYDLQGIDLRNPTYLERWKLMQNAKMNFRTCVHNPTEETYAAWALEDSSAQIMRRYFEQLDAKIAERKSAEEIDDYNISFKSEVKVKR